MRRGFRLTRDVLLGAVAMFGLLGLAGCAPEPQETIDSFEAVAEAAGESIDSTAPSESARGDEETEATPTPKIAVEPLECTPYLVITARGTSEPSNNQLLTQTAETISQARPGEVRAIDLDYPADADMQAGATQGTELLIETLNTQASFCPHQRFILLGYSQGAMVIGDALSVPEVRVVGTEAGMVARSAADRVLAIVMYGDPRFVGGEPYDIGSFDPEVNGLLPRPKGALTAFEDRVRDYCVAGDFVCQSSFDLDPAAHTSYYSNGMPLDGAAYVITLMDPPREDAATADDADISGDKDGGIAERD